MRVLVVCDGNICRSPLAAEYLRHRASRQGIPHLAVGSAGLLGIAGAPAAPHAVTVARDAGLDLTSHRSRGVSASDMRAADLVLVMSLAHLDELSLRFPSEHPPRYLLRAFERGAAPARGAPNLDDPFGGPLEAFREAFALIRICVDHVVLWIKHRP